jgi:hypothetical protein
MSDIQIKMNSKMDKRKYVPAAVTEEGFQHFYLMLISRSIFPQTSTTGYRQESGRIGCEPDVKNCTECAKYRMSTGHPPHP